MPDEVLAVSHDIHNISKAPREGTPPGPELGKYVIRDGQLSQEDDSQDPAMELAMEEPAMESAMEELAKEERPRIPPWKNRPRKKRNSPKMRKNN